MLIHHLRRRKEEENFSFYINSDMEIFFIREKKPTNQSCISGMRVEIFEILFQIFPSW